MTEEKHEDLVLEYIKGDLSPARKRELELLLAGRGFEPEELRRLRKIYSSLGELPVPEPGDAMTDGFYAMLETEKKRLAAKDGEDELPARRLAAGGFGRLWPRLAYAALFILIGWSVAYWVPPGRRYETKLQYMTIEMAEMKKMMMFSMLNRTSVSERLQAVQYLQDLVPEDDQVLTAMLDVFERDPNVNVRLATLDALSHATGDERVREGLILSIRREDSPVIQLALVDLVVTRRIELAIEPLRHLLKRPDLNMTVRNRVNEGLRLLS
ncbi:MAG: hypothetical protein JSV33_02330 [bacterium]|nr:MAG: hypothetical protein JSV33_02330 [bacterium]